MHLHLRSPDRHHDRRGDAEQGRVVGDRLRVVARRHRNDATCALLGREAEELVAGAAVLERGGELEVLELHVDVGTGDRGQRDGVGGRCSLDRSGDPRRCRFDVGRGHRERGRRARAIARDRRGGARWRRSAPPGARSTDCRAKRAGADRSGAESGDEDCARTHSEKPTSAPPPGRFVAHTRPWWRWTICSHDREAEPRAGLGACQRRAVEAIEHVGLVFGGDPRAAGRARPRRST